jgi:hypothetical protein
MTEADWNAVADLMWMLEFLASSDRASQRRCRLFACACVRRIWSLLPGEDCRNAIAVAESFADRGADVESLSQALAGMNFSRRLRGYTASARTATWYAAFDSEAAAGINPVYSSVIHLPNDWYRASRTAGHALHAVIWKAARDAQRDAKKAAEPMRRAKEAEYQAQIALLRCIFGSPFQGVAFDPDCRLWNGGAAVVLARAMYESRDFRQAPLLADMLEDSGATDVQLLEHLRGPGPHSRGCFAVDLVIHLPHAPSGSSP